MGALTKALSVLVHAVNSTTMVLLVIQPGCVCMREGFRNVLEKYTNLHDD